MKTVGLAFFIFTIPRVRKILSTLIKAEKEEGGGTLKVWDQLPIPQAPRGVDPLQQLFILFMIYWSYTIWAEQPKEEKLFPYFVIFTNSIGDYGAPVGGAAKYFPPFGLQGPILKSWRMTIDSGLNFQTSQYLEHFAFFPDKWT